MSQINNNRLLHELRDTAKVVTSESVPTQLADKIVPVLETNPYFFQKTTFFKECSKTTTGTTTVYTAPADRDLYVTGINISWCSNVTSDSVVAQLTFIPEGQAQVNLSTVKTTLVASNITRQISFTQPVKLQRSSIVQIILAFTAGAENYNAFLTGYTEEGI